MEYKIIENPWYTSRSKIGIEIFPSNEPLIFLISSLQIYCFPRYILDLANRINFGSENTFFMFYHQMDWEDKDTLLRCLGTEIQENEIMLSFYDKEWDYSIMKELDFIKIFYEYSSKLLMVYLNNEEFSSDWQAEMRKSLNVLKWKLDTLIDGK